MTTRPPASLATRAAILCNDARFQRFAATRCDLHGQQFCDSASRRDLDTNRAAAARFDILRTEFDVWTGKIAAPR